MLRPTRWAMPLAIAIAAAMSDKAAATAAEDWPFPWFDPPAKAAAPATGAGPEPFSNAAGPSVEWGFGASGEGAGPSPVVTEPVQGLVLPCGFQNLTGSARSPMAGYAQQLDEWLRRGCPQLALAVAAIVAGVFCLWDGLRVWQALFTLGVAATAAGIACLEAGHLGLPASSQAILVALVAGVAAVSTWRGFEGSQVIFGAALGGFGAYAVGGWARLLEAHLAGFAFAWYAFGATAGSALIGAWRRPLMLALAPLLGGFLLVSGAGCLASRGLAVLTDQDGVGFLPPPVMPWTLVAAALLSAQDGGQLRGIAMQCVCVCLAVIRQSGVVVPRLSAILCLMVGSLLTAAMAAAGQECEHLDGAVQCPPWLRPTPGAAWQWSVVGCSSWAVVTAVSAFRQLRRCQLKLAEDYDSVRGASPRPSDGTVSCLDSVPFGILPVSHRRLQSRQSPQELDRNGGLSA